EQHDRDSPAAARDAPGSAADDRGQRAVRRQPHAYRLGGPVSWSVTESSGLIGKLSVAPTSGRLLAGQSTTVSVSVSGGLLGPASRAVTGSGAGVCVGCQLTINPGGIVGSVIIEIDVTP